MDCIQKGVKEGALACIGVWGLNFSDFQQGMASSPIHEHGVRFGIGIGICILDLGIWDL